MKKLFAFVMTAVCVLNLAACGTQEKKEGTLQQDFVPGQHVDVEADLAAQEISNTVTENDFELTLYADKATYTVDEEIRIRATLEYKGDKDSVTIWHGDPYLTFSITDGKKFEVSGLTMLILTSTELKKGEIYEFPYQKSGGFDTLAPDAEFWREFYQADELKLPVGTYFVSAKCNFSLSEERPGDNVGPKSSLVITVTEKKTEPGNLTDEEVPTNTCPYSVMYQGTQYITWADAAVRNSFQDLTQVGEVKSLIPGNRMPAEDFQSNAFPVGTKLWLGDGQLLVETEDPDVFWVFRGWVDGEQTMVTDTVAKGGHGVFETAVNLTLDDAQQLQWIVEGGTWTEGTADCINDCVLNLNGRELYYSSDCGTFNDPSVENGGVSLSLDEETRQQVNAILEQYITLGLLP